MAMFASAYASAALNWFLLASTTNAATHAINISLGVPNATSASEIATGSGFTRQTVTWAGITFAGGTGSATNTNTVSFGPASAAATVSGVEMWDNLTSGSGTFMAFGTLATARTLSSGDSLIFNPGNLTVTLV